jgi:predicted DNA-binding protein
VKSKAYPLRLPQSLKDAVERLSKQDGTSINQFVAMAVAEKVSAMETVRFFANYKASVDFKAFDKIMKRRGSEVLRAGDEV